VSGRALRAIALGASALVIVVLGSQSVSRVWQMKREADALERELAALRVDSERLGVAVERLRDDPERIEQEARERLIYVRPGEKVLRLPPGPEASPRP
jgi:cell division protein FtsB